MEKKNVTLLAKRGTAAENGLGSLIESRPSQLQIPNPNNVIEVDRNENWNIHFNHIGFPPNTLANKNPNPPYTAAPSMGGLTCGYLM